MGSEKLRSIESEIASHVGKAHFAASSIGENPKELLYIRATRNAAPSTICEGNLSILDPRNDRPRQRKTCLTNAFHFSDHSRNATVSRQVKMRRRFLNAFVFNFRYNSASTSSSESGKAEKLPIKLLCFPLLSYYIL